MTKDFSAGYEHYTLEKALVIHTSCFEWMKHTSESSINAVVTDPPYGVKEYEPEQLEKRVNGNGGVWRIPPSFDGYVRSPLPRFTALNNGERTQMKDYFSEWAKLVLRIVRPGGHIFVASNAFL
jgi:site-specific DNA-methyltransferase (adenine-specific)